VLKIVYNEVLDISALERALVVYKNMIKRAKLIELKPKNELEFYEFETIQAALI